MSGAPGVHRRSGRSAAPSPGEAPRSVFAPPDASPFAPVTQANVALARQAYEQALALYGRALALHDSKDAQARGGARAVRWQPRGLCEWTVI